jgi:HSP20 family protein
VNKREALDELISMREKMDQILSDRETALRERKGDVEEQLPSWRPDVDIFESAEQLTFHAELPGVAKEDLTVTIENHQLILKGKRNLPSLSQTAEHLQTEMRYGLFERTLRLPDNVIGDRISAHLSNGLLEIVIPKKAGSRARRITVHGDE